MYLNPINYSCECCICICDILIFMTSLSLELVITKPLWIKWNDAPYYSVAIAELRNAFEVGPYPLAKQKFISFLVTFKALAPIKLSASWFVLIHSNANGCGMTKKKVWLSSDYVRNTACYIAGRFLYDTFFYIEPHLWTTSELLPHEQSLIKDSLFHKIMCHVSHTWFQLIYIPNILYILHSQLGK